MPRRPSSICWGRTASRWTSSMSGPSLALPALGAGDLEQGRAPSLVGRATPAPGCAASPPSRSATEPAELDASAPPSESVGTSK
eukprot:391177-Alexandrium_andersonii.AAC.1